MKMRNKGKVYPTPPPPAGDSFSVLKLLPVGILALITVLSLEDRDVLAYMLTRSIQSPNPSFGSEEKRRNGKKLITHHKPPLFDCDCFDCYTWYWFKWDSSPNRELIHQAIEAFEEHVLAGEQSKKKGKKREKMGSRRMAEKCGECSPEREVSSPVYDVSSVPVKSEECEMVEPQNGSVAGAAKVLPEGLLEEVVAPPDTAASVVVRATAAATGIHHKGLARKVLPDVLGLLNSRLWSLWSPNV